MTQPSYSIHRLIHAWGHDRLQEDGEKVKRFGSAASQLLSGYLQVIHDRQDGLASKLRVVPHLTDNIRSFTRASAVVNCSQIDSLSALEGFGQFLHEIGRWNEAALSEREVFKKRRQVLGNDHPDTISAMNNLAITLSDQGKLDEVKLDEAAFIMREVLEKRQRILDYEHPDTIWAAETLHLTQAVLTAELSDTWTAKKQLFLKKVTGKLRQFRDSLRSTQQ
jgi:hypothetical protein